MNEVSPPGWSGTVKAMKKHKDISNPFALAWHMRKKGDKAHYKPMSKDSSKSKGTPKKKKKFKEWLEEQEMQENQYLRNTSGKQEKKLRRATVKAMQASGQLEYPHLDQNRQNILKDIEDKRPLRRSEFIQSYGYDAWLDYVKKYGLPEDHKWADAHHEIGT